MNTIKAGSFFVIGIIIYAITFNMVNPETLLHLTKGEVTQAKIATNTTTNYIGYKAGIDIQRLTDSTLLEEVISYVTIESHKGQPLSLYKIKNNEDMENLKYIRNSKGRKIYDGTKKIYEYVTDPGSLKAYYMSYYLVALEDGTYMVAYLDDTYGKKLEKGEAITLPVGKLEKMPGTVLKQVQSISGVEINTKWVLNCFNEEDFKQHENMYVIIRGGVALIVLIVLYSIICLVFPKARLWGE